MNYLMRFIKPVYAHCDLPCGIYDTNAMQQAAATCVRMLEKIDELDISKVDPEVRNTFVRAINIKEQHAQLCKDQIYMLWSDYFKPEHLEKFPDLHDKMWQAAKQCGKVKQTTSMDEAKKLVEMVSGIANMFEESKAK